MEAQQIQGSPFSQFIPAKVKKISVSIWGKVKKIEAQEKSVFLMKKKRLSDVILKRDDEEKNEAAN